MGGRLEFTDDVTFSSSNLINKHLATQSKELREYLDALWDKQFAQDVKAGRLDALIARAREEHASGKTRSMDEIVRDR